MKNIRCEISRLLSKPTIWICVVVYIIAIRLLLMADTANASVYCDAYSMIQSIAGLSNFNKVLVLIAAVPMASGYSDDVIDNYLGSIILRSNVRRYTVSKSVVCFLSSFFVSVVSLTTYSLYCAMRYGIEEDLIEYTVFEDFLLPDCEYMAVFAAIVVFSLVSAVYAVLGLYFSAYVSGRFAAMAAPIVVNTFAEVIVKFIPAPLNLFKIQTGNMSYGMGTVGTLLMSAMVCAGYMYAGYFLFHRRVRRRTANESV